MTSSITLILYQCCLCYLSLQCTNAALIIEGKNEIGSSSGDPCMKSAAYYTKNVDAKLNLLHRSPCFLIEVFGPNMAISGAVFSNTACVDKFTTLSLLCQPNDYKANISVTRTLKALKNAVHRLKAHYKDLDTHLAPKEVEQLQYPVFRSYRASDGNTIDFVYTGKIKDSDSVFRAMESKNPEKKLFVKFVREYGSDAYKLCVENGYAPVLYTVTQVTASYLMVVMEEVCNAKLLYVFYAANPSKGEQLKMQCKNTLDLLHSHNLCHGDYRDSNILVSDDGRVFIIDFDWSGKANEQKIPLFSEPQRYTMAGNSLRW